MTSPKSDKKRLLLTEDGELREAAHNFDHEADSEPIYCNKCGTPNASNSSYCRKCGRSLVEQEAEMIGTPNRSASKAKHDRLRDEAPEPIPEWKQKPQTPSLVDTGSAAVLQVFTLLSVAGMSITALIMRGGENGWVTIPILITWFLVEAVRGESRNRISASAAAAHVLTMLFVAGLVITALIVGGGANAGFTIPILIVWFLVEAVRHN